MTCHILFWNLISVRVTRSLIYTLLGNTVILESHNRAAGSPPFSVLVGVKVTDTHAPGLLSRRWQHSHPNENKAALQRIWAVWGTIQSIFDSGSPGFIDLSKYLSKHLQSELLNSLRHVKGGDRSQSSKERQKGVFALTLTQTPDKQSGSLLDLWWELQLVWPEPTQHRHVHQTGSRGLVIVTHVLLCRTRETVKTKAGETRHSGNFKVCLSKAESCILN